MKPFEQTINEFVTPPTNGNGAPRNTIASESSMSDSGVALGDGAMNGRPPGSTT